MRLVGPDESVRLVYLTDGTARAQGLTAPLWLDEALTIPADVRTLTGEVIAGSSVTIDAYSKIPLFEYPDDVDTIYTSILGPTMPLPASSDPRLDALEDRISAVEDNDSSLLHKAGTETIAGVKTFSAEPVMPTPTVGTSPTTKTYVDAADAFEASIRAAAVTAAIAAAATDATTKVVAEAASRAAGDTSAIATAATDATTKANAAQAAAAQRANHTGTQSYTTVTGLGDSATKNTGTTAGSVAAGDDSRVVASNVSAVALGIYSAIDPTYGYTSGAEIAASCQAAINAMPSSGAFKGGLLHIPPGSWTYNTAVVLKTGVRVSGPGRLAGKVTGTTAGVFTWTSDLNNVVIENLNLVASVGHIFNPTGGAANWGWHTSKVQGCNLTVTDVNGSIVNHVSSRDYDNVQFLECDFTRGAGSLVPGFNIINSAGAANQNTWRDCWAHSSNSTGAPMFYVESTAVDNYAYGNVFENITGEQNPGGLIDLRSNYAPIIKNCYDYDSSAVYTSDVIRLGKSATGGLRTVFPQVELSGRRDNVTLPALIYDINMVPTEVFRGTIINPNHSSTKLKINFGTSDQITILNAPANAWTGQPTNVKNYFGAQAQFGSGLYVGASQRTVGTGSPEGVVTGSPGDEFTRTDGSGAAVKYLKGSGAATAIGWFTTIGIPPACTLSGGRRPLSGAPYPLPVSTGTWAKDNWRFMPMTLSDDLPVSFLSALCSVAPTGGTALMRFALYALNSAGVPTTLQTDYGSYGTIDLTVGAGGESTLATAGLIIPAGRWAIGCAWTGTATASGTMFTNTGAHPGVASNSIVTLGNAWQQSVSGGSAPSPAVVSATAVAGIAVYAVMV